MIARWVRLRLNKRLQMNCVEREGEGSVRLPALSRRVYLLGLWRGTLLPLLRLRTVVALQGHTELFGGFLIQDSGGGQVIIFLKVTQRLLSLGVHPAADRP